jgi:hypothetical protein
LRAALTVDRPFPEYSRTPAALFQRIAPSSAQASYPHCASSLATFHKSSRSLGLSLPSLSSQFRRSENRVGRRFRLDLRPTLALLWPLAPPYAFQCLQFCVALTHSIFGSRNKASSLHYCANWTSRRFAPLTDHHLLLPSSVGLFVQFSVYSLTRHHENSLLFCNATRQPPKSAGGFRQSSETSLTGRQRKEHKHGTWRMQRHIHRQAGE